MDNKLRVGGWVSGWVWVVGYGWVGVGGGVMMPHRGEDTGISMLARAPFFLG